MSAFMVLFQIGFSMRNLLHGGLMSEESGEAPARKPVERKPSLLQRGQDPPLEPLQLDEEYDVKKVLAEGCYSRILLTTHRKTQTEVVLKAVYEELTPAKDFCREFHYSYHLSPHPNILDSYNVTFRCAGCLFFAQEPAPLGDLAGHVRLGGLPPAACRAVGRQLASALDFMHSKELVHRDIKLENVLVFAPDFSKVKLCDFGATQREGTLVTKLRCNWLPFLPPEIYETVQNERYACEASSDSWQLAVVLFVCLTGCPPWQRADSIRDPHYAAFSRYQRRRTAKVPPHFQRFTPRALRMFRRLFEHKADKRAPVTEVLKYDKEPWVERSITTSSSCSQIVGASTLVQDRKDSLGLYLSNTDGGSRHSQENNKNKLNKLINSYGLDTAVDKKAVSQRVWEWVLSCDANALPAETV